MIIDEKYRFWLTDEEVERLRSNFSTPRGKQRVDDKRVSSGIIFVQRTDCRWRDAPEVHGPYKTLHARWEGGANNSSSLKCCGKWQKGMRDS